MFEAPRLKGPLGEHKLKRREWSACSADATQLAVAGLRRYDAIALTSLARPIGSSGQRPEAIKLLARCEVKRFLFPPAMSSHQLKRALLFPVSKVHVPLCFA